jgi:hypothetical protein
MAGATVGSELEQITLEIKKCAGNLYHYITSVL